MKIFAIGDTHLSLDPRIDKPMDIFGQGWDNHTEKLYTNWTETVSSDDIVLVAGDISWGLRLDEAKADLDFIHDLPGKKIIIKGNHDLWWQSLSKLNALYMIDETASLDGQGMEEKKKSDRKMVPDGKMLFLQNHCFMIPETKIAICGSRGWICPGTDGFSEHDKLIYERELIRLKFSLDEAKEMGAEEIIVVLHYPPTNDKQQPSGFTGMLSEYGVKRCVYGHLHNPEVHKRGLKGILNGVEYSLIALDYLDAKPLLIEEIQTSM